MRGGRFIVSLDFELYWGVRDKRSVDDYGHNIAGVHAAVPAMLRAFAAHDVHATWATVGFVMLRDAADLAAHRPARLPGYTARALDPYAYAWRSALRSDVHFAPDLVEQILRAPNQELATHTLSHFYPLEEPRSVDAFRSDLEAAIDLARARYGQSLTSLVFPRNQYTADHLRIAQDVGLTAYRGNPEHWMYAPRSEGDESRWRRGARLLDAYLPLTRDASPRHGAAPGAPLNVPATRFLRPYSRRLERLEPLRLRRILRELTLAAIDGRDQHLWWHPHNFGVNLKENLEALEVLLRHVDSLRVRHDFRPATMRAVAQEERELS